MLAGEGPQPNDIIGGRYRIVRALGSGGMGEVYEAVNVYTDKHVALKVLHPHVNDRAAQGEHSPAERLLREARAGSRIKHRHVVDIYDIGFDDGSMFLVMELLQGETLAALLERETLSIPAFLGLLLPVMRGVAEAHRQGVLHRDIKPENIFLAREVNQPLPVPMVLDFGVAKLEDAQLLTRTGHAVGTPMFMSLEQLRGERNLDARVDVYGFGVILYLALTGRAPHVARSLPELALKVAMSDALPPDALRPELPSGLSHAVARALSRSRQDRTPDMERLIADLSPYATESAYLALTHTVNRTRIVQSSLLADPSNTEPSAIKGDKTRRLPPAPAARPWLDEVAPQPRASMATPAPPKPGASRLVRWSVGASLGASFIAAVGWQLVSGRERPAEQAERPLHNLESAPAPPVTRDVVSPLARPSARFDPATGVLSPMTEAPQSASSGLAPVSASKRALGRASEEKRALGRASEETTPDAGRGAPASPQPATAVDSLRKTRATASPPENVKPAAPAAKKTARSPQPAPEARPAQRGLSVDEFFP